MTPDPVAWVSRSIGCCCRLKKRRNIGSCSNGLSSRTRPFTEIPTTPGVIRLTTGARLCTGEPSTKGIGAPAKATLLVPVVRAIPLDTTSADKTRFIAMETLELADTRFGKQPASMDVSGKPNLNRRGIASRYARAHRLAALSALGC